MSGRAGHRVEAPFERAGLGVIGGDIAAHAALIHVGAAVADDGKIAGHVDGTGAGIGLRVVDDRVGVPQLLAGLGVDRVQVAVDRGDEDLALPDGDTAIDEIAAGISGRARIGLRIEGPQFLACRGIDGVDEAPGS